MKHSFYILLLSILFICCAKDEARPSIEMSSAWEETDHYYSLGGPLIWNKTDEDKKEIIQFKSDNEFSSSERTNLNHYNIQPIDAGAARLKLYEEGKTDTVHWIIYDVTANTMKIGFEGCIEGCGKKFKRL